jgi:hypothetical protein
LQNVENESKFGKDLEMQRLVYLGWPLFRIINRWFTLYVFDWLTAININMGIVLILITLLLKVITYPLVKKSYMSSAKMRVLKPKLDAATAQFNKPEDSMQKQQAMMAEYSKYGVSPLSWLSADAHSDAYLDCDVQLRAECHTASWREFPLDQGPLHLRPDHFNGAKTSGSSATTCHSPVSSSASPTCSIL